MNYQQINSYQHRKPIGTGGDVKKAPPPRTIYVLPSMSGPYIPKQASIRPAYTLQSVVVPRVEQKQQMKVVRRPVMAPQKPMMMKKVKEEVTKEEIISELLGEASETNGPRRRERLTHLSAEEKMDRRKMKNRMAAQIARDRKKEKSQKMEDIMRDMITENRRLRDENQRLREENDRLRRQSTSTIQHHQRCNAFDGGCDANLLNDDTLESAEGTGSSTTEEATMPLSSTMYCERQEWNDNECKPFGYGHQSPSTSDNVDGQQYQDDTIQGDEFEEIEKIIEDLKSFDNIDIETLVRDMPPYPINEVIMEEAPKSTCSSTPSTSSSSSSSPSNRGYDASTIMTSSPGYYPTCTSEWDDVVAAAIEDDEDSSILFGDPLLTAATSSSVACNQLSSPHSSSSSFVDPSDAEYWTSQNNNNNASENLDFDEMIFENVY